MSKTFGDFTAIFYCFGLLIIQIQYKLRTFQFEGFCNCNLTNACNSECLIDKS